MDNDMEEEDGKLGIKGERKERASNMEEVDDKPNIKEEQKEMARVRVK
jgi:hypothetical protein